MLLVGEKLSGELPSREEERELFLGYQRVHTDEVRNGIVERYIPLSSKVARNIGRRLPQMIDRRDLIGAGNSGLIKAVDLYDLARGIEFPVYASQRIRGAILDELRVEDFLPRLYRGRVERLKKIRAGLEQHLQREPTDHELLQDLEGREGITELDLHFYRHFPRTVVLKYLSSERDEEIENLEKKFCTCEDQPGYRADVMEALRSVAAILSDIEYRIVYLYYWERLPMREIGELVQLSESRVSKIHARLLERIQQHGPLYRQIVDLFVA
jgi:RNA polymerase sigma factor for flagellar operon FliA